LVQQQWQQTFVRHGTKWRTLQPADIVQRQSARPYSHCNEFVAAAHSLVYRGLAADRVLASKLRPLFRKFQPDLLSEVDEDGSECNKSMSDAVCCLSSHVAQIFAAFHSDLQAAQASPAAIECFLSTPAISIISSIDDGVSGCIGKLFAYSVPRASKVLSAPVKKVTGSLEARNSQGVSDKIFAHCIS
jgi:hypothetical protein